MQRLWVDGVFFRPMLAPRWGASKPRVCERTAPRRCLSASRPTLPPCAPARRAVGRRISTDSDMFEGSLFLSGTAAMASFLLTNTAEFSATPRLSSSSPPAATCGVSARAETSILTSLSLWIITTGLGRRSPRLHSLRSLRPIMVGAHDRGTSILTRCFKDGLR